MNVEKRFSFPRCAGFDGRTDLLRRGRLTFLLVQENKQRSTPCYLRPFGCAKPKRASCGARLRGAPQNSLRGCAISPLLYRACASGQEESMCLGECIGDATVAEKWF